MPKNTKKNYKKKAPKSLIKQAKFTERYLQKKEPSREIREAFTAGLHSVAVANSFVNKELTNIASGTQINQKTANSIYMSGVQITGSFSNNSTVTRGLRFIILREKNPSDTLDFVTYSELYEDYTFSPRTPDRYSGDFNSPLNRDIFEILCDKRFILPPKIEGTKVVKWWCPIKRKVTYKTVANSNNASNGKIYAIAHLCELTNAADAQTVVFDSMMRIFFSPID